MTPRPGRRTGRTRLQLKHVEARRRAIAKLAARVAPPEGVTYAVTLGVVRPHRFIELHAPVELPGHHLQRAAAENA